MSCLGPPGGEWRQALPHCGRHSRVRRRGGQQGLLVGGPEIRGEAVRQVPGGGDESEEDQAPG